MKANKTKRYSHHLPLKRKSRTLDFYGKLCFIDGNNHSKVLAFELIVS